MGKTLRFVLAGIVLGASGWGSGCVSGKVLTVPGDLARPGQKETAQEMHGAAPVAVLDFAYGGASSDEIGRDFDHARSIVWRKDPGKEMPDLIADVLNESGVRAVRVSSETAVPADAVAKVWGSVDRFRVEARKTGSLKLTAESAATVSVTVHGSGGSAPQGWNSVVTAQNWTTDPLFVTPEGVRDALNGAANSVAEEVVRRLAAAGVVTLPPPRAALPPGAPPAGAGEGK